MKKSSLRPAVIAICAAGLVFLAAVYIIWFNGALERSLSSVLGYILSFVSLCLFAAMCLRFVPEWLSFWAGSEVRPENHEKSKPYTELKIFLFFLVLNFVILAVISLLRRAAGHDDPFMLSYSLWKNIDSIYYFDIAENWYYGHSYSGIQRLVFFPAYPLLVKLFIPVFNNVLVAAMFVSSVCCALSAVLLYRLILLEFDKAAALRAVKYFTILPAACFFATPMSESVFFLFTVSCVYLVRKNRWFWACVIGACATFTRSPGGIVLVFMLMEWIRGFIADRNWRKWLPRLLCMAIVPMGMAAYLGINYLTLGDPFAFMTLQHDYWAQSFSWFFASAYMHGEMVQYCLGSGEIYDILGLWLPNLIWAFAALALMFAAQRKIRASYSAWFIIYYLVTIGASYLLSGPRYLVAALPIYPAIVSITENRKCDRVLTVVCVLGYLFYLFALAIHWRVY